MAITNFVSRCLNGRPPVIYGDRQQICDFIHIDCIVRENHQLLTDDSADAEIVNVGSIDNIETLAEVVRDELMPALDLEYDEARTDNAESIHGDVSKADELLKYEPTVDIRQGIVLFIDWYLVNREWYEPLVLSS